MGLTLKDFGDLALEAVERAVPRQPAILGCRLTSGEFHDHRRIAARDTADDDRIHRRWLARPAGAAARRSPFTLRRVKD